MEKIKLEFGNPDHITLAQKGQICACGHDKTAHDRGYCVDDKMVERRCEYCEQFHDCYIECDCDGFNPSNRLKFDANKGLFIK